METKTELFIKKAREKHGNKYGYTKVEYKNNRTKITITCPIHGDFEQTPNNHLQGIGRGCRKCQYEKLAISSKRDINDFIAASNIIHSDRYTYENVIYVNTHCKVNVTCKKHGVFSITPNHHLKGVGCAKCANERIASKNLLSSDVVIEQCKLVHSNKYDYSNTVYTGHQNKFKVTCPLHGEFEQYATHHMRGVGCPKCSSNGFSKEKPGILYYLSINNGQFYKIGITNRSIETRFCAKDLTKIEVIELAYFADGQECYNKEQKILKKYTKYKHTGEKVLVSGNTELFTCDLLSLKEHNAKINSIREL